MIDKEQDMNGTEEFQLLSTNRYQMVVASPEEMLQPWTMRPDLFPSLILHLAVFLVGLVGHTSLLLYLHTTHTRHRHNINTGMFLASLSLAELLLLVVYIPLEVWQDQLTQQMKGGGVCKLKEYVKMLTALASVINLAAVSVERYIVVVHPFRLMGSLSRVRCRLALALLWILSALLSIPVLLIADVYSIVYTDPAHSQRVEVWQCTEDSTVEDPWVGRAVALYQLFTLLVIPLLLSIGCYQAVIRVLWRSARNIHSLTGCAGTSNGGGARIRCHTFRHIRGDGSGAALPSVSLSTPSASEGLATATTNTAATDKPERQEREERRGRREDMGSAAKDGPGLCSCGGYRYQSTQACSAAAAINISRRRIIRMLVIMLLVYFLCWGSWLSTKLVIWWAGDTSIPFNQSFYRFCVVAKHLPTVHATLNPFIYWMMSANFRSILSSWRRSLVPNCCRMKEQIAKQGDSDPGAALQ